MAINPTSTSSPETAAAAENFVNRAAQGAHAIVDRVAETAGPAVARVRGGIGNASERLHSGVEHVGEMRSRWVANSRGCIRNHPLASIGIAVAAGVVLNKLLRR